MNWDIEYNRTTLAVKNIFSLTELFDLIEKLNDMSDVHDKETNRKFISKLSKREFLIAFIKQMKEVVHELFNGNDLNDVRRFLSDSKEHRDSKLE